ncbi:TonB family protein [Thermodesulfobacteriota bacterium]
MEKILSGLPVLLMDFLDYTIDISILVCLIFIIRFFTQKRLPSWWNYSLWLILLVRMLVPVGFDKVLNLFNFIPALQEANLIELSAITVNAASKTNEWSMPLYQALLLLWLGGIMALGSYIFIKNLRFWIIIRSRPLLTDQKILNLLEECKSTMNIHTVMGIIVTDKVNSPALFGYIRPRLLLPEGTLDKLNDRELAYVFMHELGHLKRHDIGISWLLSIMQVVHWFNPLVWLAFYHMRVDQESACDASVLSRIKHTQTGEYAVTIMGFLEKFCENRQLPALAGVMESKSQMKRRIAMIANFKRFSRKATAVASALLITICFVSLTLSCMSGVKKAQTDAEPESDSVYMLTDIDVPPRILQPVMPKYPFEAAQNRITGKVVVKMVVTKEGVAAEPVVFSSSPEGVFDESAIEAVKQYSFMPAKLNGNAVDCIVRLPVVFELAPPKPES